MSIPGQRASQSALVCPEMRCLAPVPLSPLSPLHCDHRAGPRVPATVSLAVGLPSVPPRRFLPSHMLPSRSPPSLPLSPPFQAVLMFSTLSVTFFQSWSNVGSCLWTPFSLTDPKSMVFPPRTCCVQGPDVRRAPDMLGELSRAGPGGGGGVGRGPRLLGDLGAVMGSLPPPPFSKRQLSWLVSGCLSLFLTCHQSQGVLGCFIFTWSCLLRHAESAILLAEFFFSLCL